MKASTLLLAGTQPKGHGKASSDLLLLAVLLIKVVGPNKMVCFTFIEKSWEIYSQMDF